MYGFYEGQRVRVNWEGAYCDGATVKLYSLDNEGAHFIFDEKVFFMEYRYLEPIKRGRPRKKETT